jgi:hypothetical protein
MRPLLLFACAAAMSIACSDARTAKSGLGEGEPIRVNGGQFFAGALPHGTSGPAVLTTDTQSTLLPQGSLKRKVSGDAKKGAFAIAVRLDDIGSGYWVVPVGNPDPQTEGDLTYEVSYDVARDAAIGKHKLVLSAIDRTGVYGPIIELPIQIATLIPEGHDVISLEWDSNADLDLQVTTPEGKVVDGKHPTTAIVGDGGVDLTTPGLGALDHDSNGGCVIDGYREESLVWKEPGTPGPYQLRVNLFDACGTAGASFVVTWRRDGVVQKTFTGRVSELDANGGASAGLFIGTIAL